MNLILFGFKGVGKTYFGKKIAQILDRRFYDLDEELMLQDPEGKSCQEIYLRDGEEKFRNLEAEVFKNLQGVKNSVIALGGGTLLSSENVERAQQLGKLFFLQDEREKIKKRVFENGCPAFIKPESFDEIFEARMKLFICIKAIPIPIRDREDESVIQEILQYAIE